MERAQGFYWIRVGTLAPEIAFWAPGTGGWVLTGSEEPLEDDPAITVLAGPLMPPSKSAR